MGQTTADLLRILLADDNDANAFLFQCGVNRLARPCAFQRVAVPEDLPEKIQSFRPAVVIAAGIFAEAGELKELKQFTNGHPVICAVTSVEEAEAALAAGATDCVLVSQVDELHTCIERHLSGGSQPPYFKKDLPGKESSKDIKTPSKLDVKLEQFDRWVGAELRQLSITAREKWQKLRRVGGVGWQVARAETLRRYKSLKVQWLLRKQQKIVQSNVVAQARPSEAGLANRGRSVRITTESDSAASRISVTPLSHAGGRGADQREAQFPFASNEPIANAGVPSGGSYDETLRTLELSFKTLFHAALDPILLLDGLGCFLHANAAARALLGVGPAELLGKNLLDFVPASEKPQVSALWEALLIEGQQKAELQMTNAAGELRDVFLSARANLWFGVHLVILREQTELKRLRAAVRSFANAT